MLAKPREALERLGGPTRTLVDAIEPPGRLLARVCSPSDKAVVLGSSQPPRSLDEESARARGYAIVQRRSGGGAVVVAPGAQLWLDLFWPASDPDYEHDVSRAAFRVGAMWGAALTSVLGAGEVPHVHRGASRTGEFSRRACFAGLGPGEIRFGDRKLVGLCQRRTRAGSWFFSMVLLVNCQRDLVGLLTLDSGAAARLSRVLDEEVAAVSVEVAALEDALALVLPRFFAGND